MKRHTDTISDLTTASIPHYQAIVNRGWNNKTVMEELLLISTEVHEAINELRGNEPTAEFRQEIADIMARTFGLLNRPDMVDCYKLRDTMRTSGSEVGHNPVARCLTAAYSEEYAEMWYDLIPPFGICSMTPVVLSVASAIESVDSQTRRGHHPNMLDYYRTLTIMCEELMGFVVYVASIQQWDLIEMLNYTTQKINDSAKNKRGRVK